MKSKIIVLLCLGVALIVSVGGQSVSGSTITPQLVVEDIYKEQSDTNIDTIYKNAYDLTQKSVVEKTQLSVNEAREAIKLIPTSMDWAIGEFSKQIDMVQHSILVSIVTLINIAENETNQTNVNNARASIPDELTPYWRNSYSSAVDVIQQKLQTNAMELLNIAESEKTQESVAEARLLLNDLKEANNIAVVEWNNILIERLDKIVIKTDLDWDGKKIYLFGDSITAWDNTYLWSNPSYLIKGYPSYIKEELGGNIINKALSGATIATKQDSNIHNVILSTDLSDVDIVLITGGTNDKIKGFEVGSLGKRKDTEFNTTEYIGALRSSIHYIYSKNPKIKIYLISPINMVSYALTEYGEAMEKVGEIYSIPVLRMDKSIQINFLNEKTMMFDGVHPNNEGYKMMKDVMIPFLKNH